MRSILNEHQGNNNAMLASIDSRDIIFYHRFTLLLIEPWSPSPRRRSDKYPRRHHPPRVACSSDIVLAPFVHLVFLFKNKINAPLTYTELGPPATLLRRSAQRARPTLARLRSHRQTLCACLSYPRIAFQGRQSAPLRLSRAILDGQKV